MSVLDLDRRTIVDAVETLIGAPRRDSRGRDVRTYAAGRVTYNLGAREVYSYGTHFPLFRYIPRGSFGSRRPLFILNGDEWGGRASRTRDHQGMARDAVRATGIDSLVIPFSALDGSGLEVDSIRPVCVRDDAMWQEDRSARELAQVPLWACERSVSYARSADRLEDVDAPPRYGWVDSEWRAVPLEPGEDGRYHWTETVREPIERGADGLYHWAVSLHRLGDCVFSAVRVERLASRVARPFEANGETARARVDLFSFLEQYKRGHCPDGPRAKHEAGPSGACVHCGAPLFADVTVYRRARYLSSFDMNEPRPLYFLAGLPRGADCTSVASAVDALAPRAVHAARARGRTVERQGDVFFVETDLTDLDIQLRARTRARLTQWTRDAKPRRGEVGFVHESAMQRRARMRRFYAMRRREFRRILGEYQERTLERYRRPEAWRAEKRRRVAELRATIARHEERIAAGDGWAGYSGHTVETAEHHLPRQRAHLLEMLGRSRAPRRDRAAAPAETVGERIRRLRTQRGISQQQLAEPSKRISASYLSRVESGQRRPSGRALRIIARKLEISPIELEVGTKDAVCPHCSQPFVYEAAERYARFDPQVDWPNDRYHDAVDAIMAALDAIREEMEE